MYAQIDVVGGPIDLHSGSFGGAVENPANALATIIAALKGPDGRILVPGFYDDVVALTDADRAALAALPFDEAAYQASHRRAGPRRRGRLHRRWSARARGRRSTSTASGAGSRARAPRPSSRPTPTPRSRCRLVADQDPERIFERFRAYVDGDRAPRRHDDGHLPRRRPPEPHPDRPSGDPGRRAGARGDLRPGAGLHPRGRLHPGQRELRDRSSGCRSCCSGSRSPTTTPMPPTSGWTSTTTRRPSGRSSAPWTSWPRPRSDGVRFADPLCGHGGSGWVNRAVPSATWCATAPSREDCTA